MSLSPEQARDCIDRLKNAPSLDWWPDSPHTAVLSDIIAVLDFLVPPKGKAPAKLDDDGVLERPTSS